MAAYLPFHSTKFFPYPFPPNQAFFSLPISCILILGHCIPSPSLTPNHLCSPSPTPALAYCTTVQFFSCHLVWGRVRYVCWLLYHIPPRPALGPSISPPVSHLPPQWTHTMHVTLLHPSSTFTIHMSVKSVCFQNTLSYVPFQSFINTMVSA